MLKNLVSLILFLLFSGTAAAVTSVCSGELLPLTGVSTLKHEVSWSYHDNWFYNMYIEIGSEVEGPVSPSLVDEFEMQVGGSVLHFLENPADGQYTIRGTARVGYPLPWGFDGYYWIECPSWIGEITNDLDESQSSDEESELASVTGGDLNRVSSALSELCTQGEGQLCETDSSGSYYSSTLTDQTNDIADLTSQRIVTTGVLQSLGEESLVVRTAVGRYFNVGFDSSIKITRKVQIDQTEVDPGDTVGIFWASEEESDSGALQISVYRREIPALTIAGAQLSPSKNPGLELRSVVDGIQLTERGNLQLVYGQGATTLLVPEKTPITLVEPAQLSDLVPSGSKVRVTSQLVEDESLQLYALELLN